jgi:photosystem II stability/assembly factor-like uncharacterized protein
MPRRILGSAGLLFLALGALLIAAPAQRITAAPSPHFWTPRHPPALVEIIGGFAFVRPSAASLALDPHDGGRLWAAMTSSPAAGAPQPGLYASADAGLSWTRSITQPADIDALAPLIATNPITPGLLLASFERGVRDGSGGLQRSDDGGLSWTTRLADVRATSIVWSADGRQVYAATVGVGGNPNGGPLRSDDGGRTWQRLTSPTSGAQPLTPKVFAVDPTSAAHIWAIAGGALFESVDAGVSWTPRLPPSAALKTIAVNPAAPDLLLAGGEDGLRRSDDGGLSWTPIALPPSDYSAAIDLLAWSPVEPQTAYIARRSTQLWRSDDGGLSWRPDNRGLPPAIARDPLAIVFDPDNAERLFISLAYDRIYATLPLIGQQWLPLSAR